MALLGISPAVGQTPKHVCHGSHRQLNTPYYAAGALALRVLSTRLFYTRDGMYPGAVACSVPLPNVPGAEAFWPPLSMEGVVQQYRSHRRFLEKTLLEHVLGEERK